MRKVDLRKEDLRKTGLQKVGLQKTENTYMQKNELVEVTIEDIGVNGEGIGKVNGYTLFIKDGIIGDRVEA